MAALLQYGSTLGTFAGAWTDSRIELVRHFRHWVYVAIDRRATKIATQVPNISFVRDDERPGDPQKYMLPTVRKGFSHTNSFIRQKALTPLQSHENLEPARSDHPLVRLLKDPNEPDTAYDLWYETELFLCLTGSAYWWMPPSPVTGLPEAIWVIPSHWVWPVVGKERTIDGYEIRPVEGNYLRKFLPYEEILHFKRKNPVSKIDGYSPQTAINHWIDTQESIDRTRFFHFRNGMFPTVAIQMNGDVEDVTADKLNQIEQKIAARYTGETKANKPVIIPPGFELKKLFVSPQEMGFVNSSEQLRDHILAAYGVPASVACVNGGMTYGSVRASDAGFYAMTINPELRMFGHQVTEKLAWRYDKRLRVWWEDCTPDDPEMIEQRIKTDLLCGAVTPNEVRWLRGREAYKFGGDDPLVARNLAVLPLGTGKSTVEITDPGADNTPRSDKDPQDPPPQPEPSDHSPQATPIEDHVSLPGVA